MRRFLTATRRVMLGLSGGLVVGLSLMPTAAQAMDIQQVTAPETGVEAWLVQDDRLPLVTLTFSIPVGASDDPAGLEGAAVLMGAVMGEAGGDRTSEEFTYALGDNGIRLGFGVRSDRMTATLSTLTDRLDLAGELMADALAHPRFDEADVERERASQLSGARRAETDPESLALDRVWRDVFPDDPYGRRNSGTVDSIQAITIDDLRALHAGHISRQDVIATAAGDIDPDTLAAVLDRIFADLPDAPSADRSHRDARPELAAAGETIVVDHPVPQSVIRFVQPGMLRSDPDWITAVVGMRVLGSGGFASRLMQVVRVENGLAYSVGAHLAPLDRVGLIFGYAATANERAADSIALIREEWDRFLRNGPTDEEVEEAKTYLIGNFALSLTTTGGIAGTLQGLQEAGLGINYINEREALISAVTPAEVRRVMGRLLDPDALTFVVVGQPVGLGDDAGGEVHQ